MRSLKRHERGVLPQRVRWSGSRRLHGLKQEAHSWQVELTTVPHMLGFTPREEDYYPSKELYDGTTVLTLVLIS